MLQVFSCASVIEIFFFHIAVFLRGNSHFLTKDFRKAQRVMITYESCNFADRPIGSTKEGFRILDSDIEQVFFRRVAGVRFEAVEKMGTVHPYFFC